MNAELNFWFEIYFYLFCGHYFFQIFMDDILKIQWQWTRVNLSALCFFVLQTEKWKKNEDMWKQKRGLYSCIIYDTPSILDISLLPTGSSLPRAQMDVEDLEQRTAGLLLPTSQCFPKGYKETRLKQHLELCYKSCHIKQDNSNSCFGLTEQKGYLGVELHVSTVCWSEKCCICADIRCWHVYRLKLASSS